MFFASRKRLAQLEARVAELERMPADPRLAELRRLEREFNELVARRGQLQAEYNRLDEKRVKYRHNRDVNSSDPYYSEPLDALYKSTFDREEELRIMIGQLTQQIDQLQAELVDRRAALVPISD